MEQAARKQSAETVVVERIDIHRWYVVAVLEEGAMFLGFRNSIQNSIKPEMTIKGDLEQEGL